LPKRPAGDPAPRPKRSRTASARPAAAAGPRSSAFQRRDVAPGLSLHLDRDDRRKTNLLNVFWVGALDDEVTARAMLPNVLMRGTRRLPTLQALTRETERLYGASLSTDVRKIGERHVVQLRLEFVNDRYLPGAEPILAETIGFLREVLHEPNLGGKGGGKGRFDAEMMRQEKETHRRLIEGLINDKRSFALQRCVEESCPDEPFRRHEQGSVEDLDRIDGASMAELWRTQMSAGRIAIYFSGDLPVEEAERALAPLVEARERAAGSASPLPPLPAPRAAGSGREVIERMPIQQANLVQSYRTGIPFAERRMPGLVVGNGILGAFAHSKLFVNVREGASLCYSTGSSLERTHGMLFISSGIDAARYAEARALIEVQVEDVRAGRFTDLELDSTKRAFEARLRMLDDSPGARMDIDLAWQVNGQTCDLVRWRERLAAVTRDDVVEAFAPLAADVVYLLAPEGD